MVVAHAVPSEVQSTVGSEWPVSPKANGRVVWCQVAPPSFEENCACPPGPMLLEAAMILFGSWKLRRMSDSLRGLFVAPEIRAFVPTAARPAAAGLRRSV